MTSIQSAADKFETILDDIGRPVKPWLPFIARFLLTITFTEDAVRLLYQWDEQRVYLTEHMAMPSLVAPLFLASNCVIMLTCSFLAILGKRTDLAVAGLLYTQIIQGVGYGLLFTASFLVRQFSVGGGFIMLLAEYFSSIKRPLFSGLLQTRQNDNITYMQLFGRILLVFLFLHTVWSEEFSIFRLFVAIVGFFGCVCIVVGFKAKHSSWLLISFLSISNIFLNDFWNLHPYVSIT